MQSGQIRRTFLDFFEARGHQRWPSSSLIPNDPTLLLTGAGMVQFKPYFLGESVPDVPRATSIQKCARAVDIENVGHTARHVTFFEMLGNFSFGDYFKREAIAFGYELLTEGLGIDPGRLWTTAYQDDDEAIELWQEVGIPSARIQRRGKEDNFWSMGVAGPCGPCSEIYFDRGPGTGRDGGPVADEERNIEVWNLVFMQNVRDDAYNIVGELPRKNIDTGMGLERMAMVLQDADSLFGTDLLAPVVDEVESATGRALGADEATDVSLKVVADHTRFASFLIADGVLPSNEGRGYVLRRLLRRAVWHGQRLGASGALLPRIAESVIQTEGELWPELVAQRATIAQATAAEEESFTRTLAQGRAMLFGAIETTQREGAPTIPGDTAFQLHDTYGFPLELTLETAAGAGLEVDRDRFDELMAEQRSRARQARARLAVDERTVEAYRALAAQHGGTEFVGYERTAAEGTVLGLLRDGDELEVASAGDELELVLDRTPFYAEGGGQVGDTGTVTTDDGAMLEVLDTVPALGQLSTHRARVREGEVRVGQAIHAMVDADRREAVTRSHSATHVLHRTLRSALGEHAAQRGSLVDAGRLRFDFSHPAPVDAEQLAAIEAEVNGRLLADPDVRVWHATQEEARAAGAIALFGEKYGDVVRIVDIGEFSRELCGGTHVGHGSQTGSVRILGESSIGSNLRRIEALTGIEALHRYDRERTLLAEMAGLLRARPEEAPERLRRTLERLATQERELARMRDARLAARAAEIAERAHPAGDGWMVVEPVPGADADELRRLALAVRARRGGERGAVVLGSDASGKAALVAVLTGDLVAGGVEARDALTAAARVVGGGAGGKGDVATAGGRDAARLDEALRRAADDLEPMLAGTAQSR